MTTMLKWLKELYRVNRQGITTFGLFVWRIYQGYTRNGGALTAAAISYYALVSIIPLLLLAVSLFGFILGADRGYDQTIRVISVWAPNPDDVGQLLLHNKVFDDINNNKGLTGLVGLGVLFWIGSQFFHVLEGALDRTWCATGSRPFWRGRLMAFGLMGFCSVLLLCSLVLGITAQWVESRQIPWSREQLSSLPYVWHAAAYLAPMFFSVVTFSFVYRYVPSCPVPWSEAIAGGTFAGICWEVARVGFGYYVNRFGANGASRLYGSLGGLVLLVFWTYYNSNILVIGGEFARSWSAWKRPKRTTRRPARKPEGSGRVRRSKRRR